MRRATLFIVKNSSSLSRFALDFNGTLWVTERIAKLVNAPSKASNIAIILSSLGFGVTQSLYLRVALKGFALIILTTKLYTKNKTKGK